MKLLLLTATLLIVCSTAAMGQAGFIGVYTDAAGTDCNLADPDTALCSYYVVHSLTTNVRGSRFKIVSR